MPFFLRSDAVLDAIASLAEAEDLVIYCGAGVSIDRTGLSWAALIDEVFAEARRHGRKNRERDHTALQLVLDHIREPEHRASVITEYFTEGNPEKADDFLTPKLQSILYEENGWSEGLLLRNLVFLAITAVPRLKSVTILTTNYDTYIEQEFVATYHGLAQKIDERGGTQPVPGLERLRSPKLPSTAEWETVTVLPPIRDTGSLRVVYLHGRVSDQPEPTEGTVAFDERSYSAGRDVVTQQIIDQIAGRALLIVGASLTDRPLIHALAETAKGAAARYALIRPDMPELTEVNSTYITRGQKRRITERDLQRMLELRARHLGVRVLHPISHAQTAQFVHEVLIAMRLHHLGSGSVAYRGSEVTYSERLHRWSQALYSGTRSPQKAYENLQQALATRVLPILPEENGENQHLRLELWSRLAPSSANRTLTLIANSTGPFLVEDELLRREEVRTDSTNASVLTLLSGRPMLHTLEELRGDPPRPSRWTAFFCVPIYVQVAAPPDLGWHGNGRVPVGVITLAGLAAGNLVERIEERMTLAQIQELKRTLVGVGRLMLAPPKTTPATAS